MRASLLVLLVAACGSAPAPLANRAEPPRPPAGASEVRPIVCLIERSYDELGGMCLGIPRIGDHILVVDQAGILATVAVTRVTGSVDPKACPLGDVALRVVTGELVEPDEPYDWTGIVVDETVIAPRLVAHESNRGEITLFAIDRDGDRAVDYVAVDSPCRHGGRKDDCTDVWTKGSHDLVHGWRFALSDPACAVNNEVKPHRRYPHVDGRDER